MYVILTLTMNAGLMEGELERWYPQQLNLVEKTHPLLPTITDCLTPDRTLRPTSTDLCTRLTGLKAAMRAESPKSSQRSQSIGSLLSEDEAWLPVHVQVMEALENGVRSAPVQHGFEENLFEQEKPVSGYAPCESEVLTVLRCNSDEETRETVGLRRQKDARIIGKEDEVLEVLRCAVEEKTRELLEREVQIEAVKRERWELSVRLQQLQREVGVVKGRNSRLEQDVASKDREIQRLKTTGQCKSRVTSSPLTLSLVMNLSTGTAGFHICIYTCTYNT